ncbi:hypothetical protein E2320_022659, partial [Naja naja]
STKSPPVVKKGLAWFEDKERTRNARQAAKSIQDFFSVNQSSKNVCFVVASLPDVDTPGASIYLYEDGELVSKNFELPSKPLPFLISEVRHDSIQLKFQPGDHGRVAVSSYISWYKIAEEENWKTIKTEDAGELFLLKDLPSNTEYQLQYSAYCKLGFSKRSDWSPPIKTLPTSPPEKLRMVTVAFSVISVAWMSPSIISSGVMVKEYKLEYRTVEIECGNDQWTEKRTGNKTEFYSIEGLKSQTAYRIRQGGGNLHNIGERKCRQKELLEFFSTSRGIDHVDAICLVAQAFLSHSTHAQKRVFVSMLSILGKDLKDNIQLLITFADGGTPPVLEDLKEADLPRCPDDLGTPLHFKFKHSALFVNQENGKSRNAAAEMSWKMSTENMKDFFDSLKVLETESLTLTLEVLKKHQELEDALRRPPPPNVKAVQPKSFQISIDPVAIMKPLVSRYQVEYRIAGEENWKSLQQEGPKDEFTLEDVHLNHQYQFRCAAVTSGGLGPQRRIVIVGRRGNGISATGNTILGNKVFDFEEPGVWSGTYVCKKKKAQLKGRKVMVVDRPGLYYINCPDEDIDAEVSKCLKFCSPGPHIILH